MSNNIDQPTKKPQGKVIAGAILLVAGALLLVKQLDFFFFPHWIFSWPMWLIVWGLYSGAKDNWRKPVWFILVLLGIGFLLDDAIPNFDLGGIIWPVMIIAFGIWIIMRKNRETPLAGADYWDNKYQAKPADKPLVNFDDVNSTSTDAPPVDPLNHNDGTVPPNSYDDILNATAIFGGVNKTIFSKNFRGGDITNIFGGTELDFTQADINGRVVIDITQVFGGTKIIVPANWQVVPDLSAIFAGVDDKRIKNPAAINNSKVLILKGVSLFAGVDIRSY